MRRRKQRTLKSPIDTIKLTEATLSKQFIKKVYTLQHLNYFSKKFFIFHIPNERKSHPLVHINLKLMGVTAGIFDYCILVEGGKCGFIEFKRNSKCKLTPAQEEFGSLCDSFKIPWKKVWECEDGIDFIKSLLI